MVTGDYSGLSDLEREFEREMEDDLARPLELEMDDDELAGDDEGYEEGELEFDLDEEGEADFEFEAGEEQPSYEAYDAGYGGRSGDFVERLMELGAREFESPGEADAALNEVLEDIEREYLFGAIKRGLKSLSKNKTLRALASKGLKMGASKFLPGLQGALQLARGNVKGALLNFGKQALGSALPGGALAFDAIKSIGLGGGPQTELEREKWENFVELSREAYEHLAENLTPRADQPAEATRLAGNALQHAIRSAEARTRRRGAAKGRAGRAGGVRIVRLKVAPGERIKLIISGG